MRNALLIATACLVATGAAVTPAAETSAPGASVQAGRNSEALARHLDALRDTLPGSVEERGAAEAAMRAARDVGPAPAVPDEAKRFFVRGTFAVKDAKSPADFEAAAKEFGMAYRAAPWWPDPYFNQGIAYEGAGRYDDAVRALQLYLLAAPNAADADTVKERIYGLEYRHEKARKDALAAQQAQERKATDEQAKYGAWLGEWAYESSIQWPGMSVRHVGAVTVSLQGAALEGRLRYTGHYFNGDFSAAEDKPPALVLKGADARGTGEIEWTYAYTYPAGNCYRPDEWRPAKLVLSADRKTATYSYAVASLHHQTCATSGHATLVVKLTRGR